jgi:hypothetical protein
MTSNVVISVDQATATEYLDSKGWQMQKDRSGYEHWSKNGGNLYPIYEAFEIEIKSQLNDINH